MPARLDILSESPRNAETCLAALVDPVTPVDRFYVRSNFPTPGLDPTEFVLEVATGEVIRRFSLDRLRSEGPVVERTVTLECAGNGRTLLEPFPGGTPWTLGATGTATFTGLPLADLFPTALGDAAELLFTGADRGEKEGWGEIPFQRSLPIDVLDLKPGPLLAWEMNGEPLTPEHGAPLRLVVPGWYAVASVKWLTRIETVREPFDGYFQTDRYRYLRPDGTVTPVTRMRVRGLLLAVGTALLEGDATAGPVVAASGPTTLRGIAWSGHGAIAGVAVSTDGGASWRDADVDAAPDHAAHHGARVAWTMEVALERGRHEVVVRARDAAGHTQPLEPFENSLGYGNNVVHRVTVHVE